MKSVAKRKTLRIKMMTVVGVVVVVVMLFISLGISVQWRAMILQQLKQKAESVTRAFGISVLDAIIYSENENFQVEDLLESYIADLKNKVPGIFYIIIANNQNRIIAHSNPKMYNRFLNDSLSLRIANTDRLLSGIYRSPQLGWVMESVLPLQIAGKRWGILRIAFDANPTQQEIRRLFFLLMGLTLLITLVVLVVLSILIAHTVRSLKVLVQAMDSMDLDSDVGILLPNRDDEIGILIQHFELLHQRLDTSKKQLIEAQKQIYHAEKLASIGRLASGVAHEINNPLNGIKHCVYVIEKEPENQEQLRKYLALINEGLEHIESIVKKLLGFARKSSAQMERVNLNAIILQVVGLLEYRLSQKNIRFELKTDEKLPEIYGDASLLQEVVMNLLLNSYDAIENNNGRIEITTCVRNKTQVELRIEDNGKGIDTEDQDKIFDPFYTTKAPGEGTGLGLSVTLSIVQALGGKIEVVSKVGKGSLFKVILPIGEEKS